MRKYILIVLLLVFGLIGVGTTYGRNYRPGPDRPVRYSMPPAQIKTQQILRTTTGIIRRAQYTARSGRMRHGLGRAIAHQRRARELYFEGWYERAIAHSIEARKIAGQLIRGNRGNFSDNNIYFDTKGVYYYRNNSEKDLELEIKINLVDDNTALDLSFETDF